MLLDFEEHHLHRRIMQQAFTRDRLAGYTGPSVPAVAAGLADVGAARRVPDLPGPQGAHPRARHRDVHGRRRGPRPDDEMARVNGAFIACVQAATSIVRLPTPRHPMGAGIDGPAHPRGLLPQLPAARAGAGHRRPASRCCATSSPTTGERFSDEDVVNHMIFLLMAAHDTSTITLSTMMQYLGRHPEWRQRLPRRGGGPRPLSRPGPTRRPESLDLVMKECLRLRAAGPGRCPSCGQGHRGARHP